MGKEIICLTNLRYWTLSILHFGFQSYWHTYRKQNMSAKMEYINGH